MMISLKVSDTETNGRVSLTKRTIESLDRTVDWSKHRLVINDNSRCRETQELYDDLPMPAVILRELPGSEWTFRRTGEHAIRIASGAVISSPGWVDVIEGILDADEEIGVIGLRGILDDTGPGEEMREPEWQVLATPFESKWFFVRGVEWLQAICIAYSSALLRVLFDSDVSVEDLASGFKSCILLDIREGRK